MSTPHPMWSAIKRGMFLGGIVGLNLSFLLLANGNTYGDTVVRYMWIGGVSGLFMGAVLGMAWRRVQGPLSRLEADLKAAAAMRDKGLISDIDFQSLKTRILAAYQPDPGGVRTILTVMAWVCLIGVTISLGKMLDDYSAWRNAAGISLTLPLVAFGIGVGAAVAAIIQTALDKGGASASRAPTQSMLGAGGFDPLGSLHETDAEPIARAARGR